MRYIPGVYQGVPNQREFRAAATGRPLQWDRSDQPAALAAYLNAFARRCARLADAREEEAEVYAAMGLSLFPEGHRKNRAMMTQDGLIF